FWASGPNQSNIITQASPPQAANKMPGTYIVPITANQIAAAPQGATYLLNVVRTDTVQDDPSNNQSPLRLPHIEVVNPLNTTDFWITADPLMPEITVGL